MKTRIVLLGMMGLIVVRVAWVWWTRTEPMTSSVSRSADAPSRPTLASETALETVRRRAAGTTARVATPAEAVEGESVVATVREVTGATVSRTPNALGVLGRVRVAARARVPITLWYPQAEAGAVVHAQAEDGGVFEDGRKAKVVPLDATGRASLELVTGGNEGMYRVSLWQGGDWKELRCWVGEEPKAVVRSGEGD